MIGTFPIDNYDTKVSRLEKQGLERFRKGSLFIEGWNNDPNHEGIS